MTIAAVLLAAGRSMRFGVEDKLSAMLNGIPLAHHAVQALAPLTFSARFAVTRPSTLPLPNFETVPNHHPETGMASSIALGVAAVRRVGAEAVLIALADMPFVPTEHFCSLLSRHNGPTSLIASSDGTHGMPPILFGADWFDTLEGLTGDEGARALLHDAEKIYISRDKLIDIDQPEDLVAARIALSEGRDTVALSR